MFGFFKKKTKSAKKDAARKVTPKRATTRKTTSRRKAAPVRKAATPRTTRALCVVCRERFQTNAKLRICGRKRCSTELRQRSRGNPAPATAPAPRRAPRRKAAPSAQARPQATPAPAAEPKMTASDLAAWWGKARASGQQSQIRDWNHHHPRWRDEIVRNAAALNQAAALLSGSDRAALNEISRAAAAITDDQIRRAAEDDTRANRPSGIAHRLMGLGDRLTALTTKYERAGIIRVNRSGGTRTTPPAGTTVTNVNHAAPGATVGSQHDVTSDRDQRPPRATRNVAEGDDVVDRQIGIDLRRDR
ncbi:hypothetical protein DMH03_23915 [Amycolatopsis sp. WAC 01376]|uniref:hypothetical protein n=1 Tax=Amycolatopsis sp. WAC 01376 TaxID=2203195 RepID=UPI000F77653F|nr:hypothetical protein [Amycolatopsis sp. WAC 01376]RSM58949.1 hypothetical protein DMH03_23915 [Amycolatopsis sp. WAC 01376]